MEIQCSNIYKSKNLRAFEINGFRCVIPMISMTRPGQEAFQNPTRYQLFIFQFLYTIQKFQQAVDMRSRNIRTLHVCVRGIYTKQRLQCTVKKIFTSYLVTTVTHKKA